MEGLRLRLLIFGICRLLLHLEDRGTDRFSGCPTVQSTDGQYPNFEWLIYDKKTVVSWNFAAHSPSSKTYRWDFDGFFHKKNIERPSSELGVPQLWNPAKLQLSSCWICRALFSRTLEKWWVFYREIIPFLWPNSSGEWNTRIYPEYPWWSPGGSSDEMPTYRWLIHAYLLKSMV